MIGTSEMLLIFVVLILLFGTSKIPEVARSLGKATGEFRKAKLEIEKEIEKIEEDSNG